MLANGRDLPEVALRKESVDRNVENDELEKTLIVVALRKESVDRNNFGISHGLRGSQSLSARRAWIEIWDAHGRTLPAGSLSARRAWIEIHVNPAQRAVMASLSARRAWIEISSITLTPPVRSGRSPQGERG